ncbi:hypothetical protein EVAR_60611_1 [Eumeta japonica]|uniref:Uncharacterized protein n=1 Tax=Eumeta variegata TaxID=151549 RepID=A0A4C1YG01_EUMVA|nr:hypothetical protein EVAR_60611_1 [Eumeta japonica]
MRHHQQTIYVTLHINASYKFKCADAAPKLLRGSSAYRKGYFVRGERPRSFDIVEPFSGFTTGLNDSHDGRIYHMALWASAQGPVDSRGPRLSQRYIVSQREAKEKEKLEVSTSPTYRPEEIIKKESFPEEKQLHTQFRKTNKESSLSRRRRVTPPLSTSLIWSEPSKY